MASARGSNGYWPAPYVLPTPPRPACPVSASWTSSVIPDARQASLKGVPEAMEHLATIGELEPSAAVATPPLRPSGSPSAVTAAAQVGEQPIMASASHLLNVVQEAQFQQLRMDRYSTPGRRRLDTSGFAAVTDVQEVDTFLLPYIVGP